MSKASQRRRRQRQRQQAALLATGVSIEDLIQNESYEAARDILLAKPGRNHDEQRMLAKCHFYLNQTAEAASVITTVPMVTRWEHYIAGLYLRCAKRWKEAESVVRKCLSMDTESPWTRLLLAESLLRDAWRLTEEHAEARSLLLSCCVAGNSIPCAFTKLDGLMDWKTESSEIVALLQSGVEQHPEDEEVRCCLARRLMCNLKDYGAAEDVIAPLLIAERPSAEAFWFAFEIKVALGSTEAALHWLERLFESADASNASRPRIGYYLAKGELLLDLGRFAEATECFNHEMQNSTDFSKLLSIAGLCHSALRITDFISAADHLRNIISIWCDQIVPGSVPGDDAFLSGCGFHRPHRFETIQRLHSHLASLSINGELARSVEHLNYLLDRGEGKYINLERLRKIARSLKHRITDYDFSMNYGGQMRIADAAKHFLQFAFASYELNPDGDEKWFNQFYDREMRSGRTGNAAELHRTVVSFLTANDRHRETAFIRAFVTPLYRNLWRKALFDSEMWAEVKNVASFLHQCEPEETSALFDLAYSLNRLGEQSEAIGTYRELLAKDPKESAAWHNLSLLLEDQDPSEAIECSRKAFELTPNDELHARRWRQVQDLLQRKAAEAAKRQEEAARREVFLQTARERFPQLDFHKRRILSTLTIVKSFESLDQLAEMSGTGLQYISGNWRKLIELGMIVEDEDERPQVNKYILDLVQLERSHAVATTLIRANDEIAFKPIFNSRLEYTIYNVMIGLFPNHLVFPNMSLQTVFQYDRMKELLNTDTFRYFLMSQVDLCITSTASYLPIIAFEIDSHYHDAKAQQERDEKKNTIFKCGGVPLLRLRAHGQPNEFAIRNEIVRSVRDVGEELRRTHEKAQGMVNINLEIDFERFGMVSRNDN